MPQKLSEEILNPIDNLGIKLQNTSNKVGYEEQPDWPLSDQAKALRVLLLEPLYPPEAAWGSAKTEQGYVPPMGTISVYSWLTHRGYDIDIIDTQFQDITPEILSERLRAGNYDIVGLPVFTPTADYVFQTAKIVKENLPSCKIVMGGVHVTSMPELTLEQCPECDFIIRHEAEYTLDTFLTNFADGDHNWSKIAGLVFRGPDGKTIINPQRPFIGELNSLPTGFYRDLNLMRYVPHPTLYVRLPNFPLITQRGCPYSCSYCEAATILGKKTRFFSPQRIIEEIKILRDEKGARSIYISHGLGNFLKRQYRGFHGQGAPHQDI